MIEKVIRLWGNEVKWAHTRDYVGKTLYVRAGAIMSIKYHNYKEETVYAMSGNGYVHLYSLTERGIAERTTTLPFTEGISYTIPPKQIHTIEAITDMVVLEASNNHLNDAVTVPTNK